MSLDEATIKLLERFGAWALVFLFYMDFRKILNTVSDKMDELIREIKLFRATS